MLDAVFHTFLRPVLRPVVRSWVSSAERAQLALPWPSDLPHVSTAGSNPDRVLLIGTAAAAGVGVTTHELGLAGHLARNLAAITGRAMELDVSASNSMTARSALDAMTSAVLPRFDTMVVMIGVNEALALSSVGAWRRNLQAIMSHLNEYAPASLQVFFISVPPMNTMGLIPPRVAPLADRHARLLDAALREAVATRPRTTFIDFRPEQVIETARFRSSQTYDTWARLIARPIAAELASEPRDPAPLRSAKYSEQERQNALDALDILDTDAEDRFDRITLLAKNLFGASGAALAFIDNDRQWFKSHPGIPFEQTPRETAFGALTVSHREGFVVEDTARDPRFRDNPLVTGSPSVRFYAGHPVWAANGQHIGTLCIVDSNPRSFSEADAEILRNLAVMAQNELLAGKR